MKKYFIGSGNWKSDNWVNEYNQKTSIPTSIDDVILDDRCKKIYFGISKFHRLLNLFKRNKKKCIIYFKSIYLNLDGTAIFACDEMVVGSITYAGSNNSTITTSSNSTLSKPSSNLIIESKFKTKIKFKSEFNIKFWGIIPTMNINLHSNINKRFTLEFEWLCFGFYIDFLKNYTN